MARITCVQSKHIITILTTVPVGLTITIILNDLQILHYEECHVLLPISVRCIMYGTRDVLNNAISFNVEDAILVRFVVCSSSP